MNLSHLRYFVQLAHTKHYTKAAEQLYISQPSLSVAISKLEHELEVPLFEKVGNGLELTVFGEQFLQDVESALEILDNSVDLMKRSARGNGVVRLGLLRTLGVEYVPQLIRAFQKENPDKQVEFTLRTGITNELLDKLKQREFDIVLSSEAPESYKLMNEPVFHQDLVLIVPSDHPFASRHTIDLAETLEEPFVKFAPGSGLRRVIDKLYQQVGAQPPTAYEIQEDQVVAGMVAGGFGIAVVPYMTMLLQLDVKILQIAKPTPERKFYMVTDPELTLTPAAQAFHDFVLSRSEF